ncbi:MAG: hypothetical protein GEU95_27695 [Rhizobiales bacterium]|nr:hypothetical protein [Hyphomicrobiales bacterium]
MLVSTSAGWIADGVPAAALALDGIRIAAAIVIAAAAKLKKNFRIQVSPCGPCVGPMLLTIRPRTSRFDVLLVQMQFI